MARHDPTKTPPEKRRVRKGDVVKRVELGLTARGKSAREHLIAHLKQHPQEDREANGNGATNLALEEAAKARGWIPPKEDDE